ncbi:hypothetical protein BSKO_06987 [Bryopsis sp. KO-2023]|nr:hypothetical protein BSKO_06987 [Bryopsis sp. KO-2023]
MDICANCGMEGGLDVDGPQRVCCYCGFMEATQEEVTERVAARANTYKIGEKKAPLTKFYMVKKETVTKAYASALQSCLLDHVKVLCDLGINPSIESVIRKIWTRTLEVSRLLAPGSLAKGLKEYRDIMKGTLNGLREPLAQAEESGDEMIGNEPLVWKYVLWHLLDVESIVWVCFAGCMCLREAVTPIDVSLWVSRGKLPFMNLGAYGKRAMEEYSIFCPKGVMRPHSIPEPGRIMERTVALAKDIGLTLPDPNFPLHLMRFTCTLELPRHVGEVAVELFRMTSVYRGESGEGCGRDGMFDSFYEIGALIVVAAKYCYGLDGRGAERFAKHVPPPPRSWLEWGEEMWERKFRFYEEFDVTEGRLDGLEENELSDMVKQCQTVVFADCTSHREYDGIAAKIKKLQRGCERKRARTPGLDSHARRGRRNQNGEGDEPAGEEQVHSRGVEEDGEGDGEWCVGENALRFGMPGGPSYIPDSHLLPCSVYWLVPSCADESQTDWHLPIDYVCVLSVVSTLVAGKPFDIQTRIQGIERILVDLEGFLPGTVERTQMGLKSSVGEGKKRGGYVKRRKHRLALREGLLRGGMQEKQVQELLRFNAGESKPRKRSKKNDRPVANDGDGDLAPAGSDPSAALNNDQSKGGGKPGSRKQAPEKNAKERSMRLTGDDLESELDENFVFHALTHYEGYLGRASANRKSKVNRGVGGLLSMPITTEAFTDKLLRGDDSTASPLFNSVELFERAKLAAKFRQPFVTLTADVPNEGLGHFPFDIRGAGEVELKDAYMSVSDVESDEQLEEG